MADWFEGMQVPAVPGPLCPRHSPDQVAAFKALTADPARASRRSTAATTSR